jgi:8-oxo-dGTP pyrophosphatase MutT (NUDIX family)
MSGCASHALVEGTHEPGSAAEVRAIVVAHQPVGAREEASVRRFLAELDRLARPCDEEADPVHVTASALVVGRRGTVLHLHRRLRKWMQPGGHVDPGESPPEAARRESLEETGLAAIDPPSGPLLVHIDVHEAALGHTHLDLRYLLLGPDDDPSPAPGESPDCRWFDWAAARSAADESLEGALDLAESLWAANRAEWDATDPGDDRQRATTDGGGDA